MTKRRPVMVREAAEAGHGRTRLICDTRLCPHGAQMRSQAQPLRRTHHGPFHGGKPDLHTPEGLEGKPEHATPRMP